MKINFLISIIFWLFLNNQLQANQKETIKQYIIYSNHTLKDTITGLMWKRCAEGLSGVNCLIGEAVPYSWYNAKKFKNTHYAGYSDWHRGCTKDWSDEAFKLNPYQRPAINQKAFPNTSSNTYLNNWRPYRYWSSSPVDGIFYASWVSFKYGHDNFDVRPTKYFVRLVRIEKSL